MSCVITQHHAEYLSYFNKVREKRKHRRLKEGSEVSLCASNMNFYIKKNITKTAKSNFYQVTKLNVSIKKCQTCSNEQL